MIDVVIGYDNEIPLLAHTATHSLLEHSTVPLRIHYLNKRNMKTIWMRPRGVYDSTEFSNSRFLVPYLYDYTGWTLFVDSDVIFKTDIAELFSLRNDDYAVMCVKHNQKINSDRKFLNRKQEAYDFKNWSSLMLFNNEKCKNLSLEYVNTAPGLDLHQFKWIDHDLIGSLPLSWNYLVDNDNQIDGPPNMIHYTDGSPCYKETQSCEYNIDWFNTYNAMLEYDKTRKL
jgi:lipopolysaccharide biosynthesis glycosyltransferase